MEITIKGEAKEIADLLLAVEDRQKNTPREMLLHALLAYEQKIKVRSQCLA